MDGNRIAAALAMQRERCVLDVMPSGARGSSWGPNEEWLRASGHLALITHYNDLLERESHILIRAYEAVGVREVLACSPVTGWWTRNPDGSEEFHNNPPQGVWEVDVDAASFRELVSYAGCFYWQLFTEEPETLVMYSREVEFSAFAGPTPFLEQVAGGDIASFVQEVDEYIALLREVFFGDGRGPEPADSLMSHLEVRNDWARRQPEAPRWKSQ
jgi:hypothetical protein